MKKDGGSTIASSTTNGDSKKRKCSFNILWGSSDFAGYGVDGAGDHSDEQDENKDTGNTEPTRTPRKRKSGGASSGGSGKIGGAEVKTKQPPEDTPSKKQKSGTTPPNPPVNATFLNYFNKIQVNDTRKPKESVSPSLPAPSSPSAPQRTASEPQSTRSLKEMFDRTPAGLLRPKEIPTANTTREIAKVMILESIDLSEKMPPSSGKFKPIDSEQAPQEAGKERDNVTKINTSVQESGIDEPVIEMMDVDDDVPAQSSPAKPKKSSTKPRSKTPSSKKAATNEGSEENPKITPGKGSGAKKRKPVTADQQEFQVKVEDAAEASKEDPPKEDPLKDDPPKEDPPKNRSVLEFFKLQPKPPVKVVNTLPDKPAAGITVSEESESAVTKATILDENQEQDRIPIDSSSQSHPSRPDTLSSSTPLGDITTAPAIEPPKEDIKEVVMEESAPLVVGESSSNESEKPAQPTRRRLFRASELHRKSYNESSGSDGEQDEPVQTARKRRAPKMHKQDNGAQQETDHLPESEPEPEPEPGQEPAHIVASRQLLKSYFGSTSSLPPKPKASIELIPEPSDETKVFDLVAQPALKTYSKKPAPIKKKKAQKKRSAFSGSDEPGSDRDSRSDDDLSDFDIKVDEKPDPNQKSISSMFTKAPRPAWAFPAVKAEQRKELTLLSQSLLSGGLVNVGNTCYLNSVLQALRNTPGCTDTLYLMMRRILHSAEIIGRDLNSGTYKWRIFEQTINIFHELDEREGRSEADQIYERSLCPKQVIETLR